MKYAVMIVIFGIASAAYAFRGALNNASSKGTGAQVSAPAASSPPSAAGGTASLPPPARKYPVRTDTVKARPVVYEVPAVGMLEARDTYRVDSQVAGTIYDVAYSEGDDVKAEQVLCRIAPVAYELVAARETALYKGALADLDDARRRATNDIARRKILLKQAQTEIDRRLAAKVAGAISEEDIQLYQARRDLAVVELKDATEAAETLVKALEAAIAQREAQMKISNDDVRKSSVRAPIGGKIDKKYITNGMYVASGTPLATIVDRRSLKLRFKLSERYSAAVKPGDKIKFQVPAWPSRDFEANVYQISDQLDADARVVACLARVEKDLDKLIPGYFASVRLQCGSNQQAVVAPATAILTSEKGFVAFVIKNADGADPVSEKRSVTLGLSVTDNQLEVLTGLNAGETLVVEGASSLDDGYHVKILPAGNVVESSQ
jgi:multidrug efflux system membrane fusion protein